MGSEPPLLIHTKDLDLLQRNIHAIAPVLMLPRERRRSPHSPSVPLQMTNGVFFAQRAPSLDTRIPQRFESV